MLFHENKKTKGLIFSFDVQNMYFFYILDKKRLQRYRTSQNYKVCV